MVLKAEVIVVIVTAVAWTLCAFHLRLSTNGFQRRLSPLLAVARRYEIILGKVWVFGLRGVRCAVLL
jgi:hypothetical protein